MLHLEIQSALGGRAAILVQDEREVALILQLGDPASIKLHVEGRNGRRLTGSSRQGDSDGGPKYGRATPYLRERSGAAPPEAWVRVVRV
jgi:hypothetical protein